MTANSIEELADKLEDVNRDALIETIKTFNASITRDVPFSPNVKDGRRTQGLAIPKSNWAIALENPPFEAYAVTCGITFTFGGLKVTTDAQVVDTSHRVDPGTLHRRRDARRPVLFQLSRRDRSDERRGVRAHRRPQRRAVRDRRCKAADVA